jgi:hypothetical protein
LEKSRCLPGEKKNVLLCGGETEVAKEEAFELAFEGNFVFSMELSCGGRLIDNFNH